MNQVHKTVLVPHSAAQMYELVDKVEDYPKFLPWCSRTEVLSRTASSQEAMLYMDFMKVRQSFGTHNDNIPGQEIKMRLLKGPFKSLDGIWRFIPLDNLGCKIEFTLNYEFASTMLSALIGPVFGKISTSLVDAFIAEADKRYD